MGGSVCATGEVNQSTLVQLFSLPNTHHLISLIHQPNQPPSAATRGMEQHHGNSK
jgi:hypothetical protein